jgi:hypothetical protein
MSAAMAYGTPSSSMAASGAGTPYAAAQPMLTGRPSFSLPSYIVVFDFFFFFASPLFQSNEMGRRAAGNPVAFCVADAVGLYLGGAGMSFFQRA